MITFALNTRPMISKENKQIAQWAIDTAIANGCQQVRASIITGQNNSFEYRDRQLDKLHQSSENKLYIELFVDGKYGSFSTNRIEKDILDKFIRDGIDSTRLLAEDPYRQLPHPSRYYKADGQDLDLYDQSFNSIDAEQKIEIAKQAVEEILDSDDRIITITASYNDGMGADYMIASNGFETENADTAFDLTVEVALETGSDARSESYWFDSSLYWNDLLKKGIGKTALKRALQKIGQRKIKSGVYPMLLDNTTSSRLLAPMISAMFGTALHQKNSFLLDRLNERITSDKLTLIDTPHLKRAFGARWHDGEGVATKEQRIIDKGVLKTYFIDTYSSLKMGIEPTIASPSILNIELGNKSFDQLLLSIDKGIWVTGFNGGNTNNTTGDFSFGVEGFLVENGVATTPISEMNITGNILSLWQNLLEIGNDPRHNSTRRIPSLLFDNVNFSGF